MQVSLTALNAFAVAARHLSFKAAAEELHLTPTAVSHQIRALEKRLGHRLFDRRVRQVALTAEGEELAHTIVPAFKVIDGAVSKLMQQEGRDTVTLGAGPFFAARWLVPHLGDFWRDNPQIDLRLHHSPLAVHMQMERYDLAVAWGRGNWPGLQIHQLIGLTVSPVHAPGVDFLPTRGLTTDDILELPLLHHRDQAGWHRWLDLAGVEAPDLLPGAVFEDANLLLQAVVEGHGMALGYFPFLDEDVATGRLVRPWSLAPVADESYYLIYQQAVASRPAVADVRDWLIDATGS